MCIDVHLPAPVAVKLLPSYLLHPDLCVKKKPTTQTFLIICINITKQQNKSSFQAFISYWQTILARQNFLHK